MRTSLKGGFGIFCQVLAPSGNKFVPEIWLSTHTHSNTTHSSLPAVTLSQVSTGRVQDGLVSFHVHNTFCLQVSFCKTHINKSIRSWSTYWWEFYMNVIFIEIKHPLKGKISSPIFYPIVFACNNAKGIMNEMKAETITPSRHIKHTHDVTHGFRLTSPVHGSHPDSHFHIRLVHRPVIHH